MCEYNGQTYQLGDSFPATDVPFYREHVSPVIVVLILSVNILSISERDDYPTAAEDERMFGYRGETMKEQRLLLSHSRATHSIV